MKRIAASLLCLTLITGAFVSCSSKDSSSSAPESSAAAASEGTTEKVSDVCGNWNMGNDTVMIIGSDKSISVKGSKSVLSTMSFNSDGTGTVGGYKVSSGMFDYDGKRYHLHFDTDDDITMERIEPNDGSEFYGRYKLISGAAYDAIKQGYDNRAAESGSDEKYDDGIMMLEIEIAENKTDLIFQYNVGRITSDDTLELSFDGDSMNGTYKVEGDKLVITPENGKQKELSRIK